MGFFFLVDFFFGVVFMGRCWWWNDGYNGMRVDVVGLWLL